MVYTWDYQIPKDWKPETEREWLWYLERKINYDDWEGLRREDVEKYLPQIKHRLDPGKLLMLENYFDKHGEPHAVAEQNT